MQHRPQSSEFKVRTAQAAAVFTDSRLRRILLQFARQPRGLAEVARELELDIQPLHHAATRLRRLGLLDVVGEQPRAGRAIKLYRCTGASFFIPSALAPAPFSRGLAKELQDAIARDAAATIEGMVFTLDADGRVAGRVVTRPKAGSPPLDSWRILRLRAPRARQLKQELAEVLDRFQAEADAGGEVYLVHTGMARRPGHEGATDNPATS